MRIERNFFYSPNDTGGGGIPQSTPKPSAKKSDPKTSPKKPEPESSEQTPTTPKESPLIANQNLIRRVKLVYEKSLNSSLEIEKLSTNGLEKLINETSQSDHYSINMEIQKLGKLFERAGVDLRGNLIEKFNELSYFSSGEEATKKAVLAKCILAQSGVLPGNDPSYSENETNELLDCLMDMDLSSKGLYLEAVIFDPDIDEEDADALFKNISVILQFIKVEEKKVDKKSKESDPELLYKLNEVKCALDSISSQLSEHILNIGRFNINYTPPIVSYSTTIESDDNDDSLELEDFEATRIDMFYEGLRRKIFEISLDELLAHYDKAGDDEVRQKIALTIIKSIKHDDERNLIGDLFLHETEFSGGLEDDGDKMRKYYAFLNYISVMGKKAKSKIIEGFNGESRIIKTASLIAMATEKSLKSWGSKKVVEHIERELQDSNNPSYGLAHLLLLASDSQDRNFDSQKRYREILKEILSLENINFEKAFKNLQNIETVKIYPSGVVVNQEVTYPNLANTIFIPKLVQWAMDKESSSLKTNAEAILNTYPEEELVKYLITDPGSDDLLKACGVEKTL